jgi:hypothetical protein
MANKRVDFSFDPPPKESIVRILESVQWDFTNEGVAAMISNLPHPSLLLMWAILIQDEEIVGFTTLYLPPPEFLQSTPVFIGNFVIENKCHHAGMGSFLFGEVEVWCRNKQVKLLALQTVESSNTFFLSKGFCANNDCSDILFKTLGG